MEINLNINFTIACYAECYIRKLLKFGSQSTVLKTYQKRADEYIVFNSNIYNQPKLPPSIHRISNMYVYSDIVELSPVSNSQVLIMGVFQLKSNFQEMDHRVFNFPLYVRVRKNNMITSTMKNCSETSKEFII